MLCFDLGLYDALFLFSGHSTVSTTAYRGCASRHGSFQWHGQVCNTELYAIRCFIDARGSCVYWSSVCVEDRNDMFSPIFPLACNRKPPKPHFCEPIRRRKKDERNLLRSKSMLPTFIKHNKGQKTDLNFPIFFEELYSPNVEGSPNGQIIDVAFSHAAIKKQPLISND